MTNDNFAIEIEEICLRANRKEAILLLEKRGFYILASNDLGFVAVHPKFDVSDLKVRDRNIESSLRRFAQSGRRFIHFPSEGEPGGQDVNCDVYVNGKRADYKCFTTAKNAYNIVDGALKDVLRKDSAGNRKAVILDLDVRGNSELDEIANVVFARLNGRMKQAKEVGIEYVVVETSQGTYECKAQDLVDKVGKLSINNFYPYT